MSDNHLFPSPDLSTIFKKASNQSKKKSIQKRQNYHINQKNLVKKQQELAKQANKYKTVMSYSSMKFREAISSVKLLLTPQKPIQSNYKFSIPESFKKETQIFHNERDLYQKTLLQKNVQQEVPLVFIRGKINLQVNYQEGLGKLSLKKILNHSKYTFTNVSCIVIATNKKISKNSIFLPPEDYEIVMAQYLNQVIQNRSSTPSVQIISKWVQPKNQYLSVILRDQDTDNILFCTYCYSFKDLVEQVIKKEKVKEKIY